MFSLLSEKTNPNETKILMEAILSITFQSYNVKTNATNTEIGDLYIANILKLEISHPTLHPLLHLPQIWKNIRKSYNLLMTALFGEFYNSLENGNGKYL